MQWSYYPRIHQGRSRYRYPDEQDDVKHPAPTPNYYYPPLNQGYPAGYYPSSSGLSSNCHYNHFPGISYNAGGNYYDGHGIQKNGDVRIGNVKLSNGKRKHRKNTIIGGCHGNQGGYQVSGDVILSDI